MERFITIMRKEFIHILRDPRTLALIIMLPAILLILLGYGVSGESKDKPLAVADFSKSDASRRFVEYFSSSGKFVIQYYAKNEAEILDLIDRDLVKGGIWIPEEFGRNVDTNHPATVQFYVSGSDPAVAQTTNLELATISQVAVQDIFSQQLEKKGMDGLALPITVNTLTLYNPDNSMKRHMVPSLIPMILQIQALLLTALAIVREREQGTMEQLIVTPIHSWELMLGKIVPYLLVGIINTLATLVIAMLIFQIEIVGNIWLLIGLSIIFILGSLGMGVLISNISQTQMQAMYIAVGVVLLPAIILSGLIYPRDTMPLATYVISELLPVTHYLTITRGIMSKGVGADFLWPSIWRLSALCVGYFVASVLTFRKRI
jgi:ABC-2 type transport system permease protein